MPAFLLSHAAFAYQFYLNYLPNAEKVTVGSISIHRWHALGHELPDSTMPQLKRSDFGREFARAGYRWTEELCRADTDGDGLSNGEELGDPNCTWKYGEPHPPADTVSHPGVDERVVPFDALPVTITPEQRKNATDQWHLFFEHVPPRGAPPWPSEEAYVLRIGNRVLFSLYYILFPALWLLATFVRRKFAIGISLWGWLMAWLLLYSGIAIGSHRLFSHGAFEPARWFKCVMIFLGTMTGQGEPRYWAMMHRIHHNRCEEGGVDPHSPAEELERSYLGFAHGGFLYDRMELYELEKRAPDLMDSDHAVFADGKGILTFLLLPPLLGNSAAVYSFLTHTPAAASAASVGARMRRAAAVGYTAVSFYFYLPCVMAWQNSMLVNSAVHSWGCT